MADEIDRAQSANEAYQDAALRAHRAGRQTALRLSPPRPDCKDCGKPIPEARRKANPTATRCVRCQEIHERGANE